jgi:ABC-type nitrate/sulfonate/bicarbonate transport system substrate-binding protein
VNEPGSGDGDGDARTDDARTDSSTASPSRPPAEGRLIAGRYLLIRTLGSGGMGTVWQAHDATLNVDRALKEIRFGDQPTVAELRDRARRARREAHAAARLAGHPGVVIVHDLVEEGDAPWIVMELLASCQSLEQLVRRHGPVAPEDTARIGLAVVEALDHGHRLDILHRDVKPANVLLTVDGRVKLADFGIATYLDRAPLTQAGSISGTPTYMAPERLRKEMAGPASDLFALGATLYTAVEGRPPFPAATDAARYAYSAAHPPPRPARAGALERVLDGLLVHDPRNRLTADSAARMLRQLVEERPARRSGSAGIDATTAILEMLGPLPAHPEPGSWSTPGPAMESGPGYGSGPGHGSGHGSGPAASRDAAGSEEQTGVAPANRVASGPPDPRWTGRQPDLPARRNDEPRPSRRGLLAAGALLGIGGAGAAILVGLRAAGRDRGDAAANGTGAGAGPGEPVPSTLNLQLSWEPDTEFAGSFIADSRGYYRDAGFHDVKLLPGGTDALGAEAAVSSGLALLGFTAVDVLAREIIRGTEVRAVGALYQKYPFVIASRAADPLRTPADMIGRRIWVDKGSQHIWDAFLDANGLGRDMVEQVSDGSPPDLLTAGDIDGLLSHAFDISMRLQLAGVDIATFLLADHGYPLVSQVYVASVASLRRDRAGIAAALTAEIRGWRDNLADPSLGTRLAVTRYGSGLDEATEQRRNVIQNGLIATADTRAHGLLTVTPALVQANVRTLLSLGYRVDPDALFDLSILAEVYAAHPDLR